VKPPSRLRIAMQPNLLVALVCVVVAVGIWWITLHRIAFERGQAVAAAMQSNANLAIAFEQQAFRTLKAAEQVASFVRERYLREGRTIDLAQWVSRRVIREPMFTIVSVVDENGEVVASSQPIGRVSYADRAFFQAQREGASDVLFVSAPVLGRISGRWQIPMSLGIVHPDGRFAGVVVLSVDPASFTEFHALADVGGQGLLELTGFDGVVRGRKIGSERSFGLPAHDLGWFQRRAVQPDGRFVDDGRTTDGVVRVVSYRTLAGYPLMVTVGTAQAAVLAPVMKRQRAYLLFASAITLALLALAALLIVALARQRAAAETLRSSAALFRATFDQAAMGIAHFATDGRILRVNEKFCRMLGTSADALRGRTVFELSDPEHQHQARQFVAHRLAVSSAVFAPEIEKPYRRQDGSVLWVCEALGVVKDAQGQPDFLVAVTQDITARKDLEARLSHDASHDALTGLPNRAMFQDRFVQGIKSARRHGWACGVLYVDLDGFKSVNDVHGHAVGDQLLQQAARRLEVSVRAEDTVARLGGDEFGVVLATLTQPQDCEAVARKIIMALSTPFELDHQVVNISASIGAAMFPLHGGDDAVLLARADAAMYVAKNTGKNRFSWEPVPSDEG
jgi:diguanylate cyclase (GGDEF)-like protein/PAS domain S-box-containing protein